MNENILFLLWISCSFHDYLSLLLSKPLLWYLQNLSNPNKNIVYHNNKFLHCKPFKYVLVYFF